jgi:hypothetical protein
MSASVEAVAARSRTPYLDREIPLPPMNPGYAELKWWQFALFALALFLEVFRVLYVLWMVCILIHELGHLFGGLVAGEQFDYIRVGPIRLDRQWKITWQWTWGAFLSGVNKHPPREQIVSSLEALFLNRCGPCIEPCFSPCRFKTDATR